MAQFGGTTFKNQEVIADGNEYIGCEFRDCVMVFNGEAVWKIGQCHFHNTRYELRGHALTTISELHGIFHGLPGGKEFVEAVIAQIQAP